MFTLRVPATSANLGPGFDCLGVALTLYNRFTIGETEGENRFFGFAPQYCNENNLVYTTMLHTFQRIGYRPKGLALGLQEEIPVSRGLGSSAVCIVAGVMGANLLAGSPLSREDVLDIASALEGHPDNVAPAIYGGMTAAFQAEGRYVAQRVPVADGLQFYALIPDFHLPTKEARAVLPETVPYRDAVHNVGCAAMLTAALTGGRFDLLATALEDRLHQPYRGGLIPGFEEIMKVCRDLGAYGAYLSGAGPTLMALMPQGEESFGRRLEQRLQGLRGNWQIQPLALDGEGAVLEENTQDKTF